MPDREPHSLQVPVARVGGEARDRRRRLAAAAALVAAIALVGVALAGRTEPSPAPQPSILGVLVPTPARTTSPTSPASPASPSGAEASIPPGPPIDLPALANTPLDGAPAMLFLRRAGDDLERLTWTAGDGAFQPLPSIRGVYGGIPATASTHTDISPDARLVLVRGLAAGSGPIARLVTVPSGGLVWETLGVSPDYPVTWADDANRVVFSRGFDRWVIRATWTADAPEVPVASASAASPSPSTRPVRTAWPLWPVGFSTNGLWLFAGVGSGDAAWKPAARISIYDGYPERLAAYPAQGSTRLSPATGTGYRADPATGRVIVPVERVFQPGGIPSVEVAEPDGSAAYRVRVHEVIDATWTGDGGLLVLEADAFPLLGWTRLVRFDDDGRSRRVLFETGHVSNASILAVRDGFALVAWVDAYERSAEIGLVRLSDGAASGLRVGFDEVQGLELGAWLPQPLLSAGSRNAISTGSTRSAGANPKTWPRKLSSASNERRTLAAWRKPWSSPTNAR